MEPQTKVKIAVVQPYKFAGGMCTPGGKPTHGDARNLETACTYIAEAAAEGARLVAFPQFYPGPSRDSPDISFDEVAAEMGRRAREHSIIVLFCGARLSGDRYHNTANLVLPSGEIYTYNKMIPSASATSEIPGNNAVVVETEIGKIGLLICWEAWFPELARILALKGAELLLFPCGGLIYELRDSWTAVLQCRAAENTALVASCVSLFGVEDGMAHVFSPEGCLGSLLREGILCVEVDMGRLRTLRSHEEELVLPKRFRTIPGVLRSLPPSVVRAYCDTASEALLTNRT